MKHVKLCKKVFKPLDAQKEYPNRECPHINPTLLRCGMSNKTVFGINNTSFYRSFEVKNLFNQMGIHRDSVQIYVRIYEY